MEDIRLQAAQYYDLQPAPFEGKDIEFYRSLIPSPQAQVLELGCGTGRVLVPLAESCAFIQGIDLSEAMIAICREKLCAAGILPERGAVQVGDICVLHLGYTFDLITAPFRVFQNLEEDEQIDGFFRTVREHLAPGGSCVLNVFRPWGEPDEVRTRWQTMSEDKQVWERPTETGRLIGHERMTGAHLDRLIGYPSLTYRYYEGDQLKDEAVLNIVMRCYYSDEFEQLIQSKGFTVISKWGGYAGEKYGDGPELVVQFTAD